MSTQLIPRETELYEQLVRKYFDALNRQDVDDVMALLHPGAAYYDAFWLETHVGQKVREAYLDAWDDEPFWYVVHDQLIPFEGGIAARYDAFHRRDKEKGELMHQGSEIFVIEDNKILSITAYWVSPYRVDIKEAGEIARKRHGVVRHS